MLSVVCLFVKGGNTRMEMSCLVERDCGCMDTLPVDVALQCFFALHLLIIAVLWALDTLPALETPLSCLILYGGHDHQVFFCMPM
jgi:hypothetical protein